MKKGRTMMVVGLGTLGTPLLEYLASSPAFNKVHDKIVACDVNEDSGARVVNNARAVANQYGVYPNVEFAKIDLRNADRTTEILKDYEPDLVFHNTTLLTWWLPTLLTVNVAKDMHEAGVGPFVPCHIALLYNLMQAIKKAGLNKGMVVNASIPDITSPMLAKIGMGYKVGIGNLANYAPIIKYVASRKLNVDPRDITLYWYAHHGVVATIGATGTTEGAPYYLRIYVKGKDVTENFDPGMKTMQTQDIGLSPILIPIRKNIELYNHLIAMSAYRVIMGIWKDTGEIFYAPGPNGLPGGWTVKINAEGAEPVLPEGVTLDTIAKINEEGGRLRDGVEQIKHDGTLIITKKSQELIKKHLGLDYKEIRIEGSLKLAEKIVAAFKTTAEKLGAKIPR